MIVGSDACVELHPLHLPREGPRTIPCVIGGHERSAIVADIAWLLTERERLCLFHASFTGFLAVDEQRERAALGDAAAIVGELQAHLMVAGRNHRRTFNVGLLQSEEVVANLGLAVLHVDAESARDTTQRDNHALCSGGRHLELRGQGIGLVLKREHRETWNARHRTKDNLTVAADQIRTPCDLGVRTFGESIVERQHVVLHGFDQPELLQLVQDVWMLLGQILRLRPVLRRVVQLPDIVVECDRLDLPCLPRCAVLGDGRPALVVDAAIAEHLEVLGFMPICRPRIIERIGHAHAFQRTLQHAIHHQGLRQSGNLENRGGYVDHMMKLRTDLTLGFDTLRPVDDRAISRTAKM